MFESAAISAKTLLDVARHRARLHPDTLAFDYCRFPPGGEQHSQLTYRQLDVKARAIAASLQRQGAAGERVVVLCPSGVDFVAAFFGCIYAGAAAIPVHPPVRSRVVGRVASILRDVDAGFVLATAASQSELKSAVDGLADGNSLRWCAVDDVSDDTAAEWVSPELDPDTIALLQYTSGSTNTPKGVVVTHANLLHNLETIAQACGDDSGVFWLPLHHDMGLIGGVLETLYLGGSSYFMPPEAFIERPMRWLEAISRHRATTTTAPNFAYELCIEHSTPEERAALDLSNWRSALCGAEPVRAATMDRFADAFACAGFRPEAFHPVYGLAEATLLVSGGSDSELPVVRHVDGIEMREHRAVEVSPEHPAATQFVGCGQTYNGQELVITDPESRQPCRPGEVGEIWLAGGGVAAGYWGRPDETEQTFRAFLVDGRGPFLRTGDLGFELDGELFVTGRLKDLVIIRGRNYYPEDIEAHVQDSHPGLLRGRGACFSVASENGSEEELVVVQEVDRSLIGDDVDAVIDAIRTTVTEQHQIRPYAVVLVELLQIPTTSSGKIRRTKCRESFLDGELQVFTQWCAPVREAQPVESAANSPGHGGQRVEEISAWLVAQLARELDLVPAAIDVAEPFAHYGLDSVHAIRLTAALATWLGRELSPTLAYEYPTIELAARHLAGDDTADAPRIAAAPTDGSARTGGAQEPIAIIGIGCRFPGADGPTAFWKLLSEGTDAVTEVSADRWGAQAFAGPGVDNPAARWAGFLDQVDQFDAEFFSISPRESARMDPQQRLLLEVAWEAMEDAGQVPEALEGSRTGVFVGISTNEYGLLQFGELEHVDAYTGTGSALSIAANRLSYVHDFRGPSMAIDTACSSSLVAIHLACRSLSDGDCTLALAGGVNVILSPKLSVNFDKAGVMAADGRCKTFDAEADGYVRGEGAGIVVLKPLDKALADGDPIYSVIRGSATNQDGRTNGLMAPSPQSQEAVLTEAYRRAELSPGLVQYVEAHGTGTSLGDAIEAKALGAVLAEGRAGDSTCLIGSVKTNIGHLEAAAGVAGLIKVALAMRHRMIPPSLNFTEPNPNIPFDRLPLRVAQNLTEWPENGGRALAGVSSFGFGGANAHVVLAEAPYARVTPPANDTAALRVELLPLSARSPEALTELAARYEVALDRGTPLAELCYTAGARRGHHGHRVAVIGDSAAAMSESLSAYRRDVEQPGLSVGHSVGRGRPGRRSGPVFVFSGQGSQWCGMGQQLYAQEPVFRDALAMCDEVIRPHLDRSVVAELLAEDNDSWLGDIGIVQPAIFAVQVAQTALWRSWGVEPEAVIGHSLGEVTAAYVAGALTLADAAQVICARARLLRRPVCRGAMVAAELTLDEARDLISGHEHAVAIAAANSHRSMVLSGDPEVLTHLVEVVEQRSRFCRWIKVDVASHSPQMAAVRSDLLAALSGLAPTAATLPMYSTVTGEVVTGPLDADYWVENLCSPVHFSAATRHLLEAGHDSFLEVSPHPILLSAMREDADDMGSDCTLLPSMRNDDGGRATPLASLGSLYTHGQPVAWEQLYPWGGRCVAAPTYPWQRRHFWTEAAEATVAREAPASAGVDQLPWRLPLRSAVDPQTAFCEIELGTDLMPVLSDHRVHGAVVVPAAILIELVLSAAAATFGLAKRVVRDVDFRQSLLLADARQRTVQVVLHQDAWGAARFECYSLDSLDSRDSLDTRDSDTAATPGSPRWSLLASGAVAADEADRLVGERHPPEATAASCPDVITGSSFYHRLAEHGLRYGPGFAAVERIWRRDGEAVARLTPSDADRHHFSDGRNLDASFQVLAATLAATGSVRDTYLPVGVTELRTHETSTGGLWCHAQLCPSADPEPDTIEGDVFLLRDDGQIAMSARGLRLRRIPEDRPATPDTLRNTIFELQWHIAAQTPASPVSEPRGSWLVFSDGSATSQLLRAHLEQSSQSCVLVEPGAEFQRHGPDAYRLDPAQPQHFRQLVDEVFGHDRRQLRGVVHLWSLLATAAMDPAGTSSVLHLTQALTLAGLANPPRLWLVTNGAQVVTADDPSVTVAAAPLWGMGRSIALEHPELRCARVDLAAQPGPDEIAALARELWADGSEADVALRGTSRYVARLAPRDDAATPARRPTPGSEVAFRMEYPRAGVLDDVRAVAAARPAPRSDEVEIRVHAAGLNFIDAMRALGVYPGQGDGPVRVGIECSGVITGVGADVHGLAVGDAVVALAMDGVGSFVTTPACLVAEKPGQLSFEAAAALPIAYLTAYYGLFEQARLRRGEHVLIHSGAGGVGLAAVQVARWLGATVYATAGTEEKREHLHSLGVEHVFDSRSLAFADEVLAATGGKGVDVVLNSLTGEAIVKGLAVLRPSGRFVEIGKRDVYGHGSLRMWQLRNNASYTVVDLAQLVVDRPGYVGDLLRRVATGVAQGAWAPSPVRTFGVDDTAAAIRCLSQGKQIGKVVVSLEAGAPPAVHAGALPIECDSEATYLITGGLGGLGRAVATWLVEQGARHLVLMGRTAPSAAAQQSIDALRKAGAQVVVARGDVARVDHVTSVVESIRMSMPPLRGVVHAAGVLDDGAVAHLDQRRLRDVMAPKVDGAWNLHALTRDVDLDFFVLFSSAAAVLGSPGQAHYAAANSFLDALAWHRRAEGRPALSINWGPWAEVGLVNRSEQVSHLNRHGIEPISVSAGVATLSKLLRADATQAAVLDIDWRRWRSELPQGVGLTLLADLGAAHGGSAAVDERKPAASLGDEVRRADPPQRRQLLQSYLRDQAAAKLGLAPERLAVDSPLNNLGADSLIAMELRTQIERDLGVAVPIIELLDGPSIATLASRLAGRLSGSDPGLDPDDAVIAPTAIVEMPGQAVERTGVSADAHPLSWGQRSLWFLHNLAPASPAYTITYAGRITGDLDVAALERAAQALVDRHAILSTTYAVRDDGPIQLVHPESPVHIARHELGPDEAELRDWLRRESNRPFNLQTGPVFRLSLLRLGVDEHVLVLAVHHIAVDFWSIDVMLDELRLLYAAEYGSAVPPMPAQRYVDYVDWQLHMLEGTEADRLWDYWRQQLAGDIANIALPIDRPRPAAQTYRGALHRFTLDAGLGAAVREAGQRAGATPYVTFLAAFATLLHRYSGQEDLLIGSPFGCRDRQELEGLVGYVANPVVLRADVHGDPTFTSLLSRMKDTVLGALAHQDYPFALLVERLRPARDLSHAPLSQVSFAWEQPRRFQDGPGAGDGAAALNLTTVHVGQGGAPVDLMMQVGDADGEFTCVLQYSTDLFDDATIEGVARHFVTLLRGIVADPDSRVSELPLLTDTERRELAGWNDTWVGFAAEDCIHDMVAAAARRSPDATAVWFEAHDMTYREMTYAELDRRADALAHRLQGLSVGAGSIVAVLLDRCDDLVVALLGVLKAGGAFMPIDPAQPTNRIGSVLAGAPQVTVCLTHQRHLQHLEEFAGHPVILDQHTDPTPPDAVPAIVDVTSSNAAYVVHTSGSTGAPKGAVNTHAGLRNYLLWMADTYRVTDADRVLHHTPVTFDASLAEIFLPLILGARLVIARPDGHKDVGYLVRTIAEQSVTQVVHVVPSILRAMLADPGITQCAALRRVSCGGEVLPYEVVQRFWATLDAELWNEYGPAEAAITTTAFHCERASSGPPVPIGRPIANVTIHIVDAHLQPVPVGVPGELLIGGAGVGLGYLNQLEATAARFIPGFAADSDRLLYRTGDLARYLPGGSIEYLGRADDQVEIHGVRIEPSEVEAALDKHPGIQESAVVAGTDGRGNTRLVAHFVAMGEPAPTTAALRRFLLDWLPAAMVPALFTPTHALPRTAGGKVDRRALATDADTAGAQDSIFVAPRTRAERILADIWRDVLEVDRVGVHDDFFALGGSSTQSLQISLRANAADLPLRPESMFLFGTIAELAAEYDQTVGEAPVALEQGIAEIASVTTHLNGNHLNGNQVNGIPVAVDDHAAAHGPTVSGRPGDQQPGNTVIESIGTYLPAAMLSTDSALAGCVNPIGIPLERLTGIKHRRVAGDGEFSIDLARNAADDCLARSSYGAEEIDLIISCNISRYDGPANKFTFEPSTAARLRDQCGLTNALAFDLTNACAGMFTGITVADAFLRTGLVQRAMVVSGEYITHLIGTAQQEIEGPMDPRLACLTVGDAGAAVILERGQGDRAGFHDLDMATLSKYSNLCIGKATSGAHGGAIMLVDSIAATAAAVKRSVPYVGATMVRHGWRPEHCDHILMHQTSDASLNDAVVAVNRMFGYTAAHPGNVISNLAERGNTASTTHFVALADQIRNNRIKSGDNVVFGISGSGATVGAALYTFDDLPDRLRRGPDPQHGARRPVGARSAPTAAVPRVAIKGVGIASAEQSGPPRAVDLAAQAAAACLTASGVDKAALGLMIHAGIYRDEFVCEPAIAALVAGELGINDDIESSEDPKTLAFDVLNGAVGFLNACHVAVHMIGAGKAEHAMVMASEVENNTPGGDHPQYGLNETGSALMLGSTDGTAGFGQFVFHHRPENAEALATYIRHEDGHSWLQIDREPKLTTHYLDVIPAAVEELLRLEGLEPEDIAAVFPPHLAAADLTEMARRINIPRARLVEVAADGDLFTSTVPYALDHAVAHQRVKPGDIGLIVSVGSGVQVGCAIYRF